MSTFKELVKKDDRQQIIWTVKGAIYPGLNISIDDLITFTKRVKSEYRKNTIHDGICSAMRAIVNKYDYNGEVAFTQRRTKKTGLIRRSLSYLICRSYAIKYVQTKEEWDDPFKDTSYWWNTNYYNDAFCSRCVKPRLLFLDWVITVLTAYKNEYLMSNINQNDKSKTNS